VPESQLFYLKTSFFRKNPRHHHFPTENPSVFPKFAWENPVFFASSPTSPRGSRVRCASARQAGRGAALRGRGRGADERRRQVGAGGGAADAGAGADAAAGSWADRRFIMIYMGMDQYLLILFLVG